MRYAYLANNRVGFEVLRWLVENGMPPTALVVHPGQRAKYRDEMIAISQLDRDHVLQADLLHSPEGLAWLRGSDPEWLISVYFGFILKRDVLEVPQKGAINLHPALLPFNRGANPNVWSIVDGTPAGVTLHFMESGIDVGDIIGQREVTVSPADTGATLYSRLEEAAIDLFHDIWPLVVSGTYRRVPQCGQGSMHRVADLDRLDRIDPSESLTAQRLIDIIRARTFPPYRGAYLDLGSSRVYLELSLEGVDSPKET